MTDTGHGRMTKVIDSGRHFLPQHRGASCWWVFRRDLQLHAGFTLPRGAVPGGAANIAAAAEPTVDTKFILTPVLWKYLLSLYPPSIQAQGNGFGCSLVDPANPTARGPDALPATVKMVPRTLVDRGWTGRSVKAADDPLDPAAAASPVNAARMRRLMGTRSPQGARFRIPVIGYAGLSISLATRWWFRSSPRWRSSWRRASLRRWRAASR